MNKAIVALLAGVLMLTACGGGSDVAMTDSDLPPAIAECGGSFPIDENPPTGFSASKYKVCSTVGQGGKCLYVRNTVGADNQPVNEAWDYDTGAPADDMLSSVGACVFTTQDHLESIVQ